MSYIIQSVILVKGFASCHDLKINKKNKSMKDHVVILWGVMTSHIRSMSREICWELTNIVLVIVAINRK